jgi:predicted kinase
VAVVFDLPADAYHANNSRRPDRRVERQVVERQLRLLRQALADIPAEGYAAVYVIGG